jgi:tetratricopeptide (TPR) repeat protein
MGGWIVAVLLTTVVGVIGYYVGRPYLASATKGATAVAALDPKAAKFLSDGEHAIDEGNLDLAKENFDKASALQEKDPHVLLDVAKLAAIRADIPWLKLRLLPDSADDEVKATKLALSDLVPGLKRAADDAAAATPDDPVANRVKVDALRIAGEVPSARNLVSKMGAASQPEALYVLAALDLGEMAPLWNTVIDRLRIAAAAEGNLGRARAALVYSLARNNDSTTALAELGRLSPRHPLASALRAFVQKAPAPAKADGGAAPIASGAPVDVNSLPHTGGSGAGSGSSDPRVLIEQAAEAENRGQLPRAAKLYEDALHADPNNSEALAGLGTVSLKQEDPATARQYFARALGKNPNFMPALVGQADALWKEGDKNGAVAKYKDIVERFPESSGYPAYCKTRAAGSGSGSGAAAPAAPAPSPNGPPPAAGGKPGELSLPANTPGDLPGATPP